MDEQQDERLSELEAEVHAFRRRLRRGNSIAPMALIGGGLVAAVLVLPTLGEAVPIPHLDPNADFSGEISGTKMRQNFENIEQRLAALENVAYSPIVSVECAGADATCDFNDALSGVIEVIDDRLVRFDLVPGDNGHLQVTANNGNTHVEFHLERRPGVGAWTEVASTSVRFESVDQGVVALPCAALSLVDQSGPPAGTYEYRLIATWLDLPPGGQTVNIYSCGAMLSDAGPRPPD